MNATLIQHPFDLTNDLISEYDAMYRPARRVVIDLNALHREYSASTVNEMMQSVLKDADLKVAICHDWLLGSKLLLYFTLPPVTEPIPVRLWECRFCGTQDCTGAECRNCTAPRPHTLRSPQTDLLFGQPKPNIKPLDSIFSYDLLKD